MSGPPPAPDIVVLNLARSAERLASFLAINAAQGRIMRAEAVDGRCVDRAVLRARGVIGDDLRYADGALGNALSHLAQWERAAVSGRPRTVIEDDAVLCHNFHSESSRLMARLPLGWDLVMWGYNFDTYVTFEMLPGISGCVATFDQAGLRRHIGRFPALSVASQTYRLISSLGIAGYTVSPTGASRLLAACLPLRQARAFYPGLDVWLEDRSIDYRLNSLHATLSTYVAMPPLLVTANDHDISTVQ